MDNKDYFSAILKEKFGFVKHEDEEDDCLLLIKTLYNRDFQIVVSVSFEEKEARLGVTVLNKDKEGLDLVEGKFSLDRTKKLIDRYRKICKI